MGDRSGREREIEQYVERQRWEKHREREREPQRKRSMVGERKIGIERERQG